MISVYGRFSPPLILVPVLQDNDGAVRGKRQKRNRFIDDTAAVADEDEEEEDEASSVACALLSWLSALHQPEQHSSTSHPSRHGWLLCSAYFAWLCATVCQVLRTAPKMHLTACVGMARCRARSPGLVSLHPVCPFLQCQASLLTQLPACHSAQHSLCTAADQLACMAQLHTTIIVKSKSALHGDCL